MRKRDELTNPSSCMSRARDDEWTFVLLGRDAAAAATVEFWADERIRLGKNKAHDPQILEARGWAAAVRAEREATEPTLSRQDAARLVRAALRPDLLDSNDPLRAAATSGDSAR